MRLESVDVPFLDEKVDPGHWYPVNTLGHFLDVLAELSGHDPQASLVAIGEAAADMAAETGRYQQLDTTHLDGSAQVQVLRYGRLVTSVITAFYNFSRMSFGPHASDPEAFQIDWYDVVDLPESNRHCAQGFIARIANRASATPMVVESARPTPDHVVFTLRAQP